MSTVGNRYELGPVIGVGSSAVVRRGRDLRDGDEVAVKIFHPGAVLDERQQRQEMQALADLDHPGLVGLRGGGQQDGRPFVVTELVEGPTLAARIAEAPIPAADVRRIGAELAAALAHVHAGGYVHRDIKPANVLLGDGSQVRLADFGISRAIDATAATTAGCVVGTAAYLAPEQVRGETVGPPTDVFALGLVLLEALTGRREYPGSAVESATARLHRAPTVPADLPVDLAPVLAAMLAARPGDRPDAATVAGWLAPPPVRHRATGAHRRRGPLPGGRRALLAAAALVLAAGVGVAALELSTPAPTPSSTTGR